MGASKLLFVTMREEEYLDIPMEMKQRFIKSEVIIDDYEDYKDNPFFKELTKAKRKADKDLKVWKFNQRNNK